MSEESKSKLIHELVNALAESATEKKELRRQLDEAGASITLLSDLLSRRTAELDSIREQLAETKA